VIPSSYQIIITTYYTKN